MEIVVENY